MRPGRVLDTGTGAACFQNCETETDSLPLIEISSTVEDAENAVAETGTGPHGPDAGSTFTAWAESGRKGKFPLAPIIAAWQDAQGIEPDRSAYAIAPGAVRKSPGLIFGEYGESISPADTGFQPDGQLPLFEGEANGLAPYAHALQVFDAGGGLSRGAGGAPYALRMHTEFILSVPYALRSMDGRRVNLRLQDLIDFLALPNFRMERDFPKIVKGLRELDAIRLAWPGGFWRIVSVLNMPVKDRDSRLVLYVSLPPGATNGAAVHRDTLRGYGRTSYKRYRAWLGCCEYWDRYGTNQGRLIHAARPAVRRNEAGLLLDKRGEVIAGRGGVSVRSNWDKRAIPTGETERNPNADRYPFLDAKAVRELVYGPDTPASRDVQKSERRKALETLKAMEADGSLMLEYNGKGGVRMLPPAWFRRT